eukprot:jgi/Tetstr1/466819/TSEL_001015.t1
MPPPLHTLVLNAGSSSLKYAVYRVLEPGGALAVRASGLVERIGASSSGGVRHTDHPAPTAPGRPAVTAMEGDFPDHQAGLAAVLKLLERPGAPLNIACVGHRVVHGGPRFQSAAVITDDVTAAIEEACALAPLHNPPSLSGIRTAQRLFDVPQVAVFDTAFHMTLPPEAYTYALPKALADKHGIRRYGFHGINYSHVVQAVAAELGKPPSAVNIVACHLGAGASMACVEGGRCVDTTMGLTPLEGLPMAMRAGDVDPGAMLHLAEREGLSLAELGTLLNRESGMKGMCGHSDMRSVNEAIEAGDPDARLARAVFVHRVRRYLGAFHMRLRGQMDAVVFTGGIGENDAALREEVCAGLSPLGIELDSSRNATASSVAAAAGGVAGVHSNFSRARVLVVRANEEGEIARQATHAAGVRHAERPAAAPSVAAQALPAQGQKVGQVYLAPLTPRAGTASAAMGLIGTLVSRGLVHPHSVLPFVCLPEDGENNALLRAMIEFLHIKDMEPSELYGVAREHALNLIDQGKESEVIDEVLARFKAVTGRGRDFHVVVGGDYNSAASIQNHLTIAAALGIDFYGVGSFPRDAVPAEVTHTVSAALMAASDAHGHCRMSGMVLNRLPASADLDAIRATLAKRDVQPLALMEHSAALEEVTAMEIAHALQADVRYGHAALSRVKMKYGIVATLPLPGVLEKIQRQGPGALIVTHSGRGDMILGLLAATRSRKFPPIAGILLSGGGELSPVVQSILHSRQEQGEIDVPILSMDSDTLDVAQELSRARHDVTSGGIERIEAVVSHFDASVDESALQSLLSDAEHRPELPITPRLFQWQVMNTARRHAQHIILPEGNDKRVVTAAGELLRRGICKLTILGKPEEIMNLATSVQVDISAASLVDPETDDELPALAAELADRRKAKGMTLEAATQQLCSNPNMYATMMMATGAADGMVSGAIHTTADTMRPALQGLCID